MQALRGLAVLLPLSLAACAGLADSPGDECSTSLVVTPSGDPIVGSEVRVTANIFDPRGGIPTIEWRLRFGQVDVPFTGQGTTEIAFTPSDAGTYDVVMSPSASGSLCRDATASINVVTGQPGDVDVRLHVIPPLGVDVPPIDRVIVLPAGAPAYALGTVTLEPGRITDGTVGRQAYLRFIPDGQPEAVVEAYTSPTGAYSARVQTTPHHILVVPQDPAYPPQVIVDGSLVAGESYALSTGVAITGTVLRPNGTPLADAKIQVFQQDTSGIVVPSTIGTSLANGTFTLRAFATNGTDARVVVTPPAGLGLPRLEATSASFNFANPIQVSFASSLATRNLSGTTVTRGAALAGAKITIVGTIPVGSAGTITAGGAGAALGIVRVPVTASGSGVLPSALVPATELYAVVEPASAPGDAAVVPFDTTTAVPSTIAAPAMVPFTTTLKLGVAALGGARFELVPVGALGIAGVGPTVLFADETGVVSGTIASGAVYRTYITDPVRRAAPQFIPLLEAPVSSTFILDEALVLRGTLQVQGQTNRIDGAAVQVLCNSDTSFTCDGVDRDRALGEDASNAQGSFEIAVTRPGVPI